MGSCTIFVLYLSTRSKQQDAASDNDDNIKLRKSSKGNINVLARSMLACTHKYELAALRPFEMLRISSDGWGREISVISHTQSLECFECKTLSNTAHLSRSSQCEAPSCSSAGEPCRLDHTSCPNHVSSPPSIRTLRRWIHVVNKRVSLTLTDV